MPTNRATVAGDNMADAPIWAEAVARTDADVLSTAPEGSGGTRTGITDQVKDNGTRRRNRGEQQAVNMRQVLEFIRRHANESGWLLTENCIKELNQIVLDGIPRESYSAGDYKRHKNYLLDGRRRVVFIPPPPRECAPLVAELVQTVNRWIQDRRARSPTALHPVRIAAIACGQLIAIHPFAQGNGRTARAVATMILATFSYTPLPSDGDDEDAPAGKTVEWYFDQHLSDYYAGLHAARRGNWPIWMDIFAEAVEVTMKCPMGLTCRAG
jgi:Fic family protein